MTYLRGVAKGGVTKIMVTPIEPPTLNLLPTPTPMNMRA